MFLGSWGNGWRARWRLGVGVLTAATVLVGCSGEIYRAPPGDASAGTSSASSGGKRFGSVEELAAAIAQRRLTDRTGRFSVSGAATGRGEFVYEPAGVAMKFTVNAGELRLESILLPAVTYLTVPNAIVPDRPWIKIDTRTAPSNPQLALVALQARLLQDSVDPATVLAGRAVATEIVDAENVTLNSTAAVKYTIRTDRVKFAQTIADPNARNAFEEETKVVGNSQEVQLWLARDNKLLQGAALLQGQQSVIRFSDWGQPVRIVAPPDSQVMQFG